MAYGKCYKKGLCVFISSITLISCQDRPACLSIAADSSCDGFGSRSGPVWLQINDSNQKITVQKLEIMFYTLLCLIFYFSDLFEAFER